MSFPQRRLRRLRRTPALRRLVAETVLGVDDLVAPLFVREGIDEPQPIASLPGVVQHTRESLRKEVAELQQLGVPRSSSSGSRPGRTPRARGRPTPTASCRWRCATSATRWATTWSSWPTCASTSTPTTGTAGCSRRSGEVDNDATLERYAEVAIAQAEAGADVVAPSGMMDGQVLAIRDALDEESFEQVAILAYAAKYASALYGPFRDAVDVNIADGGDRKAYQQDFRNAREALEELRADVGEGADLVMVKPALAYLDIIVRPGPSSTCPSRRTTSRGEYAMVKAAGERGWIDADAVALEHITAIKRAGADLILTYFARDLAEASG